MHLAGPGDSFAEVAVMGDFPCPCERVILPALARGAVVISDRFADSTRVYQALAREGAAGAGEGLPQGGPALAEALHRLTIGIEPVGPFSLIFLQTT